MVKKDCKICSKEFLVKPYVAKAGKGNYCSPECYHKSTVGFIPWNKGTNIVLKPKTGWSIVCKVCGKEKYYQLNEHEKRKREYCSPECYHLDSRKDDPSYSAIHSRIKRDFGKAEVCEDCGSSRNVEWANISHTYTMERRDWRMMCRKCHFNYDYKNGWGDASNKYPELRKYKR